MLFLSVLGGDVGFRASWFDPLGLHILLFHFRASGVELGWNERVVRVSAGQGSEFRAQVAKGLGH